MSCKIEFGGTLRTLTTDPMIDTFYSDYEHAVRAAIGLDSEYPGHGWSPLHAVRVVFRGDLSRRAMLIDLITEAERELNLDIERELAKTEPAEKVAG